MRTVVVGAGAAGLWCALHAAEAFNQVTIVAPDPSTGSATALAQGGIAAAVAEEDDPERHAGDTLIAGAGLSDPAAVRALTQEAAFLIEDLVGRGMEFDAGRAPMLEGGHSARRVLHAGGDATGWWILKTLLAAVRRNVQIRWLDARAAGVHVEGDRARGIGADTGVEIEADRVVLATGGATGIFGRRTGPERAFGEGMVLGWDAGAALADLEFVQFHPTALDIPGRPARLLTEALRGEGAVLLDADGLRFMPAFNPKAELAPRDVVARAIWSVRERTGSPAYLDARKIPNVRDRFPTAARSCQEAGLDLANDLIPVASAAHYFIGGVLTDLWGRTTVPGLFACGECASTGVHGANRLASNSLLETLVFGRRAALAEGGSDHPKLAFNDPVEGVTTGLPVEEVRGIADSSLGVVRSGPDLDAAGAKLAASGSQGANRSATLVAWLVAQAAHRREESRGAHYRTDFPGPQDAWTFRQAVASAGWASIPVPST